MKKNKLNSGFNLSEIMIAILVIAVAFLPTIGVLGTSIRATSKDDSVIRAMNLCQEKLDTALKFPFSFFNANLGLNLTDTTQTEGTLSLPLTQEVIKGVTYRYILRVEDRPGSFSVMEKNLDTSGEEPGTWKFNTSANIGYDNIFHRYRMTVFWTPQGDNIERSYSLVTFRADLRTFQES